MNFWEIVAILIFYGILYYGITTFSNKISHKTIGKDVFQLENQVFFWIAIVLYIIFMHIGDKTNLQVILKAGIEVLLLFDILFYFFIKFTDYPFFWAIYSIILDLFAFPAGVIIILIALGAVAAIADYPCCYWWWMRRDN